MVRKVVGLACAPTGTASHHLMRVARWLFAGLAVLFAAGSIQPSQAEEYPVRTIKIIVPFPAGGPTDVAARLIAQSISSKLGKGVIVENHAGAAGRIGAKLDANAPADGYTLLLGGTNVNAINGFERAALRSEAGAPAGSGTRRWRAGAASGSRRCSCP